MPSNSVSPATSVINTNTFCAPVNGQTPSSTSASSSLVQNDVFKPTFYDPHHVKHRKRTSPTQFKVLETIFRDYPKPDSSLRRKLAERLSMTPRAVQVWFQNRRAKEKNQRKSDDEPVHKTTHVRQQSTSSTVSSQSSMSVMCSATTSDQHELAHVMESVDVTIETQSAGDESTSERSQEEWMLLTPVMTKNTLVEPMSFIGFPVEDQCGPLMEAKLGPYMTQGAVIEPLPSHHESTMMWPHVMHQLPTTSTTVPVNTGQTYSGNVADWIQSIPDAIETPEIGAWNVDPTGLLYLVYPFHLSSNVQPERRHSDIPDPKLNENEPIWRSHQMTRTLSASTGNMNGHLMQNSILTNSDLFNPCASFTF